MPPEIRDIPFAREGGSLRVEISFPTLQVVSYTLTLYEAGSNSIVLERPGNNMNEEDDKYELPTPVAINDQRFLQLDATFVDPGRNAGAPCRAEAHVKQGTVDRGCLVVAGKIDGTSFSGTDFVRLVLS